MALNIKKLLMRAEIAEAKVEKLSTRLVRDKLAFRALEQLKNAIEIEKQDIQNIGNCRIAKLESDMKKYTELLGNQENETARLTKELAEERCRVKDLQSALASTAAAVRNLVAALGCTAAPSAVVYVPPRDDAAIKRLSESMEGGEP